MLLEVSDLSLRIGSVELLDRLSFSVDRGQVLGLVGESGSGKSLTALALTGLARRIGGTVTGGRITFDGQELTHLPEPALRKLRGKRIAFITQNPMSALDALKTIGDQVDQVSRLHLRLSRRDARARTVEILTRLRIPEAATVACAYPHQLSGGMKQRVVIAMALAADADLIVADEPTTALDVTIQAQILGLLRRLALERGVAVLFTTHDLGAAWDICDRVMVMYAGQVAEVAPREAFFAGPRHPYGRMLLASLPEPGREAAGIPGDVPDPLAPPPGCRFNPRCPRRTAICTHAAPPLTDDGTGRAVACHHPWPGNG